MHWNISKIIPIFNSRVSAIFFSLLMLLSIAQVKTEAADVRVLVDVSGSMKKADPNSVRGQATALLAALLPEDSNAGIWLFGSTVRELVPYGSVDSRWNALTQPIETSIGSEDKFTHMESALRAGLQPSEAAQNSKCHIILITDGIVDVQGGSEASTASRNRILKSVLPYSIEKGCRIHSIALSNEADLPLLKHMALETEGLFTLINRPGDLIPVMLDALDLALRSQQLPVRNQQIRIDNTIRQVRIIRLGKDTRIALTSDTTEVSKSIPNNSQKWFEGRGYQTLIWSDPEPGQYKIMDTFFAKDRILIDTDVILDTPELPPTINANQTLGLSAFLRDQSGTVEDVNREFRLSFGSGANHERIKGSSLRAQIDSPDKGRAVLTIQSFDGEYERQIQRAFEILEAEIAPEIPNESSKSVVTRSAESVRKLAIEETSSKTRILDNPEQLISEVQDKAIGILPEELKTWSIWQIAVIALSALALIGLLVGMVVRPKSKFRH